MVENANGDDPMEICEDALSRCKFGLFQYWLLSVNIFGFVSVICATTNNSFLLTTAGCYLNMTVEQKGLLNATPYGGMICSGFICGFLVDTFGRKKFLVGGFMGIFITTLYESLSQNFFMLVSGKFIEGIILGFVLSAQVVYLTEVCPRKNRDMVVVFSSIGLTCGTITVVLLAWGILTLKFRIEKFNGKIVFQSWNLYIVTCGLFSFLSSLNYLCFPESPKYLIALNYYDRAEKVLRRIYATNSGRPPQTFDISFEKAKNMRAENEEELLLKRSVLKKMQTSLGIEMKYICKCPSSGYLVLFCFIMWSIMLVYNTLRLWYPQMSAIIEYFNANIARNVNFCTMINTYMALNASASNSNHDCSKFESGMETYRNSMIVAASGFIPIIISGLLVNRVGKKVIMYISLIGSLILILLLPWTVNQWQVLLVISGMISLCQTAFVLVQAFIISIFPTQVKSLVMSAIMNSGRLGTLMGNIIFPIMLKMGCFPTIISMAGILLVTCGLVILIPKKNVNT